MTNSEMRKEIGATFNVKGFAIDNLIAERAEKVAKLGSNLTYTGLTRQKGIQFMHSMNGGSIGTARINHIWFDFETVLDNPSRVIEWSKQQTAIAIGQGCK